MTELATTFFGALFGGGGATAGAATAATATGAASTGASILGGASLIGKILTGALTVGSMVASVDAGNKDATQFELQARDTEAQKPLETLQGINRRTSIKQALAESVGNIDTAYAASGTDLSFGSPSVAREQAFRKADSALNADVGTEQTRIARLDERAANERLKARNARDAGETQAGLTGMKYLASLF